MEAIYFVHIDSGNLPAYYGCACVKPSKYFTDRSEDIQSRLDSSLLMSKKRFAKDSDCALEIVLSQEEERELIPINGKKEIFILNTAIPISRVRKIYFDNGTTKDKIITLVNMSTAFIPASFAKVIEDNDREDYTDIVFPNDFIPVNLDDKLKRYDSLLGGFSLMRLAADENINFSENYFSTLSYFNSVIETELKNANKKINDIYWGAFDGSGHFAKVFPYLNKQISEDDLYKIVKEEGQEINKDKISGKIDINSLEGASYIVAVLYTYGLSDEGRKSKIDGPIINGFRKEIKIDKSEVVALCYGLNRGYSVFSNRYKSSNIEKIVKFELTSQLDYYTIESLFQSAFRNSNQSSEFPYLDSWCPKLHIINKKLKSGEYIVLDKVIKTERIKVGSQKWWSNFLRIFFQKNSEELFKPFLIKAFEKIKNDLQEEINDEIIERDDQLNSLLKENNELKTKVTEVNQLKEKIKSLISELEILKENHNSVNEAIPSYAKQQEKSMRHEELSKKYNDLQKLLKEVNQQTNIKKAKELIQKHYGQGISDQLIDFPDK
jgi:hypothetical protein